MVYTSLPAHAWRAHVQTDRQTDRQRILAMLDEDAVLPEILQFLGPTQLSFSRGPRGVLAK